MPQAAPSEREFDLLVKLLGMTTSSVDAEALVAMRKANELLARLQLTWPALLRGRVTVLADPFANIVPPQASSAPPRAAHASPSWAPPQPQAPSASPSSSPPWPGPPPVFRRRRAGPKTTLADLGLD